MKINKLDISLIIILIFTIYVQPFLSYLLISIYIIYFNYFKKWKLMALTLVFFIPTMLLTDYIKYIVYDYKNAIYEFVNNQYYKKNNEKDSVYASYKNFSYDTISWSQLKYDENIVSIKYIGRTKNRYSFCIYTKKGSYGISSPLPDWQENKYYYYFNYINGQCN